MKADLSRDTFDPTKRYAGVLLQQGRVLLPADLNEESRIRRHRAETEAGDVIGACGAPDGPPGSNFQVGPAPDVQDIQIGPGRIYVDGLLCELTPTKLAVVAVPGADNQVEVPIWRVDGRDFAVGQWVELNPGGITHITDVDRQARIVTFADPAVGQERLTLTRLVTFGAQPDQFTSLPAGLASGRYLVYLDVWERHITALEDQQLREVALGGPDTATRSKVVWQVKLTAAGPGVTSCDQLGPTWPPATPSGRLRARIEPVDDPGTPCLLPPERGFQGLENQLYRIEIHKGGELGTDEVIFKWQRDNATVVAAIEPQATPAATVTLRDLGPDPSRGFANLQLVEATDDRVELDGPPPPLLTIVALDPTTREVTLSAVPDLDFTRRPKLRRWDGQGVARAPAPPDTAWLTLDPGLQVQFLPGTYRAGDFWLVPARTATGTDPGTIEWPRDDQDRPLARAPLGVEHHFCALALVDFDATTGRFGSTPGTDLFDCRPVFPPLTGIAARHVGFDDSTCGLGATTVQVALDALCQRQQGTCTVVVAPQLGWEQALAQIGPGQDANICFQAGNFVAPDTVDLADKGHLTLTGCGRSTRLRVANREAVLRFQRCASVTIRDLDVEGGLADTAAPDKHLRGAIDVRDCPQVEVQDVRLACAAQLGPTATCLTVAGPAPGTPGAAPVSVRIRGCVMDIGFLQAGILLTDVARAQVTDNELRVQPFPPVVLPLFTNPVLRAGLRRWLLGVSAAGGAVRDRRVAVSVTAGGQELVLWSDRALGGMWQRLLDLNPPPGPVDQRGLRQHLGALVDRVLLDDPVPGGQPLVRFIGRLAFDAEPTALQGIVVGGQTATEVRIRDNTVRAVVQGIHVGVSHHEDQPGPPDLAGRVTIDGNTVDVLQFPLVLPRRHGIFVGNCDSLVIEGNYAVLRGVGLEGQDADGIRVYGYFGRRMLIVHNHMENFPHPIVVRPLNPNGPTVLWQATENTPPGPNPNP
jgi:hypothetical protein